MYDAAGACTLTIQTHYHENRILYLHHLRTKGKDKLAGAVLEEQIRNPLKGDFAKICDKNLEELDLKLEEIESMTKREVKQKLKEAISKAAFEFLLTKKTQQSKGKEVQYNKLETQKYLRPESNLSLTMMRRIFQLRTRNLLIKRNFPNKFSDWSCVVPECDKEDSQPELLKCEYLDPKSTIGQNGIEYDDLFSDSVEKQVLITRIIYQKYQSRDKYLASSPEDPGGS